MKMAQKEIFDFACDICEQHNPIIAAEKLTQRFGRTAEEILKSKCLEKAKHSLTIDIPGDDGDIEVEIVRRNNAYYYFSASRGWVLVRDERLLQHSLSMPWFLEKIAKSFGISITTKSEEKAANTFWYLGNAWVGKLAVPIYFARRLNVDQNHKSVVDFLANKLPSKPSVIITTTNGPSSRYELPEQNHILHIKDIFIYDTDAKANIDLISSLLRGNTIQEGFSVGFRTANFNGVEYSFSKTQAAIIEALHDAGKPIHKSELMPEHSAQDEPKAVFRSKNKETKKMEMHPAWGKIIKYDNKGNYWLA